MKKIGFSIFLVFQCLGIPNTTFAIPVVYDLNASIVRMEIDSEGNRIEVSDPVLGWIATDNVPIFSAPDPQNEGANRITVPIYSFFITAGPWHFYGTDGYMRFGTFYGSALTLDGNGEWTSWHLYQDRGFQVYPDTLLPEQLFFEGGIPAYPPQPYHGSIAGMYLTATTPVPEPSTLLLIGISLAGFLGFGRKRFRKV